MSSGSGDEQKKMRVLSEAALESRLCLGMAKSKLPPHVYNHFISIYKDLSPASECGIRNTSISTDSCLQKAMELLQGHDTEFSMNFKLFIEGHNPFLKKFQQQLDFLTRLKKSGIREEDYRAFLEALEDFSKKRITSKEDLYQKAEGLIGTHPEFLKEFKGVLFDHSRAPSQDERSCTSPKSMQVGEVVKSSTPDANPDVYPTNRRKRSSQLECPSGQNHDGEKKRRRDQKTTMKGREGPPPPTIGDLAEEDEDNNVECLPNWSPSREKQLPPQVDLEISKHRSSGYCRLSKKHATLQSSYQTTLGRSVLNDVLVCVTSGGSEDFKCRTINQYEEHIFKCEDDMFESDMLLERLKETEKFIRDLLDRDKSSIVIKHIPPLHRRCIKHLYGDHGPDILDLLETEIASSVLVVLRTRIKKKIETVSKARLELVKECRDIIANNHKGSLNHRNSSPSPNSET